MTPHTFYVIVAFFVTFCIGYALGLSIPRPCAPTPTPLEASCLCPSLPTPKP